MGYSNPTNPGGGDIGSENQITAVRVGLCRENDKSGKCTIARRQLLVVFEPESSILQLHPRVLIIDTIFATMIQNQCVRGCFVKKAQHL